MNALIVLRPDATSHHGGDAMLARSTAQALAALGVRATVVESASPDARGYDIVHLIGIFEPETAQRQVAACDRCGARIAISPIWMDLTEVEGLARECERILRTAAFARWARGRLGRARQRGAGKYLGRRTARRLERRSKVQSELLCRADVLVPNGAVEARECALKLGAGAVPFVIAPICAPSHLAVPATGVRHGVLCVGRIETRKNQALLAFALRDDPIDITCVGDPYDPDYFRLCRRWAGKRTRFAGRLPDAAVNELFAGAAVHAMPSWCETAGIASLQGAMAGAQVVVGDRGSEIEYFGDDAEYADPADPESIRAAVLRALRRPPRAPGDSLDRRVRALTWQLAAERTKQAYEIALGSHESRSGR